MLLLPAAICRRTHLLEVRHFTDTNAQEEIKAVLPATRLRRLFDPAKVTKRLPVQRIVVVLAPKQSLANLFAPRNRFGSGVCFNEQARATLVVLNQSAVPLGKRLWFVKHDAD